VNYNEGPDEKLQARVSTLFGLLKKLNKRAKKMQSQEMGNWIDNQTPDGRQQTVFKLL
jgi:hypothetical protein